MHPPIEPFANGLLRVASGNDIYWETSGNPHGRPALFLHGGPGAGLGAGGYRRRFDPDTYLIIGIDQRGCGRSRPLITDELDTIADNTTQALIDDIEAVREHLRIEKWVVTGVSWGSTLALAYAQAHPGRVTEIVLAAVTSTSRAEVDWITETVGRIFPEAWDRFESASGRLPGERVVEAYARRLATGEAADRARATDDWHLWEDTHISLDPLRQSIPYAAASTTAQGEPTAGGHTLTDAEVDARAVFATLTTHYWAHDAFLTDGDEIANRMHLIGHIPAVLVHGRHDISAPVITPWILQRRWPASRLVIVESEGHGGPAGMQAMCDALDAFGAVAPDPAN